ncbi:hypothetical protein AK812_SmicGene19183 [Symbiodinium microadriaticum]|uniref:Amino acid transporter transmembrane domain-containing protein n=1 Tax=Symbiodinium microadriaticum TaxID=2951 RepID=A0A1Q9DT77_SYMMI|nr:hypothetical protein AK812_SmicGene19183 [Symbiodinium microadriaticum]
MHMLTDPWDDVGVSRKTGAKLVAGTRMQPRHEWCWHGLGCTRSGVVETWTMALDVAPSSSAEPLSPFLATVAVMKAIVGLCCLTLPAAFAEVRLTLALLGIVLVCVALGTGTYRVAQCYVQIRRSQDGGEEDHGLGPLGDISREVFGWQGIRFCYVAILASQFGLAVAYTDVIVPTVMKMLGLSKLTVQLWVFGISGILSFIKQLQGLAWLSIVALAAFMYIAVALLHFGLVPAQAHDQTPLALDADPWVQAHPLSNVSRPSVPIHHRMHHQSVSRKSLALVMMVISASFPPAGEDFAAASACIIKA